ncbi:MFS 1 domain containing protein, partial [Asbolus verrucosus]
MTNTTLWNNLTCDLMCEEDLETDNNCIYKSLGFWCFVIFMCVGTIGFNVVNSITDAICFDVIGDEGDYGRQRVWGTVGYGVTALISGYIVDFFSTDIINYTPAFVIMLICAGIDLISCVKIQLPIIEAPKNLFRDFKEMLKDSFTVTFLTFAIFAGILDSLMVFFLLCISYALRIGLISLASSPWWIIPIEFCLNGPSYALTYSTIVAYANDLAPPGASATMQGIAAGMDDGLDNEYHYGKQRLWGSIGFGLTALLAGYVVNIFSESSLNYAPAFIAMFICSIVDLLICIDLELPVIAVPMNIFRDVKLVLINKYVITFITFTVLAGILDSLIIYFLFWYLEELAITTRKILERFGHVHCFTMCFINYAIRLGLISIAPSPWWILPIEFFMQGPTYALTYTTIVAYANELAPPGASATMQGIAAGMGDGTGYAIGSIIGGLLYTFLGGKNTFVVFTGLAVICGALHFILHQTILKTESHVKNVKE